MSILLDALKKSEEQRQLGNTPDIHAPGDHRPDGENEGSRRWLTAALLAVSAVAIVWVVWAQYRPPAADEISESVSETPQLSEARPPGVTARAPAMPGAKKSRTPVESFDGESAEPAGADQQSPDDTAQRRELAQTFNQYQKPAEAEPVPSRKQAAPTRPKTPVPEQREPAPGPDESGPAVDTPLEPHISEPISYWELPQNVRDDMPEFRITVMVYADEPGDRFMLINGQRLVESESIDGVELVEIRRHGAVFRYRTYEFLVKG